MFKSLFGAKSSNVPHSKLPPLHSFVDVMVGGRPARNVTVDAVGPKGIVTKECLGRVGESAVIIYTAPDGRFRMHTKIASATAATTQFDTTAKVSLIGAATASQKRSSVRLDTLVTGAWRFAPGGVGTGEFARGTIRDISRGGCSLICERAMKLGTKLEVQLPLRSGGAAPVVLLGEVMRHDHIPTSGKHSHGLRFQGVRPEEEQAIVDFINKKQADLRSRGLA
jgi:hypothetical protein